MTQGPALGKAEGTATAFSRKDAKAQRTAELLEMGGGGAGRLVSFGDRPGNGTGLEGGAHREDAKSREGNGHCNRILTHSSTGSEPSEAAKTQPGREPIPKMVVTLWESIPCSPARVASGGR